MLTNINKIIFTFALLLTFVCTFAHAERRLMSAIEGNWKLEKVRVLNNDLELADSGYLTISANKEVSYQGLCQSYVGELVINKRESRRSKKRGRLFRFDAGFKLSEITSGLSGCLGLDEFEANRNEIFRSRVLKRNQGTLKFRTGDMVFTFRRL